MTAPVTQQASEPIAMTAPVMQQSNGHNWRVRFVMPSAYTMERLPRPKNPVVKVRELPGRRFAAVRFSGWPNDGKLEEQTACLKKFIAEKNLKSLSDPTYAFYNPPWTLPFFRRNEVLIEVDIVQS
jgi:hypothetical protein